MVYEIIDIKKHSNYVFKGCEGCPGNCCSKFCRLDGITLDDYERVSKYFPVFFVLDKDFKQALPVLHAFIALNVGVECPYLTKDKLCSIYEERSYICKKYPFGVMSTNEGYKIAFRTKCLGCVAVSQAEKLNNNYMRFFENGSINSVITESFIDKNFTNNLYQILTKTKEYIDFCFNNNLLEIPQKIILKDGREIDFANSNIANYDRYRVVNAQKFNELPPELKKEAHQKNYIYYMDLHLKSLDN